MTSIDHFPLSDQCGSSTMGINTSLLQQLAAQTNVLNKESITEKLTAHHLFLRTGGAGGFWTTILLKGLVLGMYNDAEGKEGQQASFEQQHLCPSISLSKMEWPFSNFCCVYAPSINFEQANLSHCLFTDAFLENANFTKSNLKNSDFSRANLTNKSFVNADCSGADFENCDLRGADFTNTCLRGARFPGANLEGIRY